MTPIKCARIERAPGCLPPTGNIPPGHSWYAVHVEHVPALGQWSTWALVPDETPATSPTEADIARRVDLLQRASTLDGHPDTVSGSGGDYYAAHNGRFYLVQWSIADFPTPSWVEADEAAYRRELERVAIRQLLTERGAK